MRDSIPLLQPLIQSQGLDPWVRKIPWIRKWQPTPEFLPGEPHRERSLVGTIPRVTKKLDMTEHLYREENKALFILTKKALPNCCSNAFKGPSLGFYLM